MNWEKLGPNLSFSVEKKMGNLHKIWLFPFQTYASNFKNLSMNWETNVFHWEKWNFEPTMNSGCMYGRTFGLRKGIE